MLGNLNRNPSSSSLVDLQYLPRRISSGSVLSMNLAPRRMSHAGAGNPKGDRSARLKDVMKVA